MITFYKYHGAGNDFVIIDNRSGGFDVNNTELVKELCHRRFGIGADGVILLENPTTELEDFSMVYFNSDGSIGAMCGNGGRCVVHFAYRILNIVKDPLGVHFMAVDGEHEAEIIGDEVKLKMQDVTQITERNGHTFLCSGTTPHNVVFVENVKESPVVLEGKRFQEIESDPKGVNVNFVEEKINEQGKTVYHVRTYERGVWDETMACGTGATSVAIACSHLGKLADNICNIHMPGGNLTIQFEKADDGTYQKIWLTGPAKMVYKGEWEE